MSVRLTRMAREDVARALAHYRDVASGLDRRFLDAIEATLSRLARFPESGSPDRTGTRRARVRGFSFCVVYRRVDDQVVVFAIAHLARSEAWWSDRIHEPDGRWIPRPLGGAAVSVLYAPAP